MNEVFLNHAYPYLAGDTLTESLFLVFVNEELNYYTDDDTDACSISFNIYQVVPSENEMKKRVESLGDRVLFLGHNSWMIVMGSEFPALKGNCIYFALNEPGVFPRERLCVCVCVSGVFNLEDRTVQPHFLQIDFVLHYHGLYGLQSHLTLWREIWEKKDVTGTASGGICLTIFFL